MFYITTTTVTTITTGYTITVWFDTRKIQKFTFV